MSIPNLVTRRIKVLHFISDSVSIIPYLTALGKYSDHQRFEICFGSLSPEGPLQQLLGPAGFRVLALGCRARRDYPRAIWRLRRWLIDEQVDVLQTHLFEASFVGLAAARLAGVPVTILSGHHSHEIPLHRRMLTLWTDRISTNWLSHRLIAYSVQMKNGFMRDQGVRDDKITILPFPIELGDWRGDEGNRSQTRKSLGLEGKTVFGAVGRLFWVKNYELLIRAFQGVAAASEKATLLLVGSGAEKNKLEKLAEQLSIRDRVIFVNHTDELAKIMGAMDVFVHSSLAEAFCLVIVHAFSLGIPVVSTDVGIARELVEDGVTGFLAPAGIDGMRRSLERILESEDHWRSMGAEGRRRIARFSAAEAVRRHEELYASWLGRSAKAPVGASNES